MTAALAASATLPPVAGAKPVRVQRKRTRGWKMPPNTKCVDRSTKWGNPFVVEPTKLCKCCGAVLRKGTTAREAILLYETFIKHPNGKRKYGMPTPNEIRKELRGYNLACFCKEGEPCHADILLEIANAD